MSYHRDYMQRDVYAEILQLYLQRGGPLHGGKAEKEAKAAGTEEK